ncbi:hypothetical protein D9V35_08755 [Commensalibacter melissae]|nr:hypothetical protein D9V35_08755 [Commensalibacter melissae]
MEALYNRKLNHINKERKYGDQILKHLPNCILILYSYISKQKRKNKIHISYEGNFDIYIKYKIGFIDKKIKNVKNFNF